MDAARNKGRHRSGKSSRKASRKAVDRKPHFIANELERRPRAGLLSQTVAGVALATATTLTATAVTVPPAPQSKIEPVAKVINMSDEDIQLASSILNIPVNLLIDVINMPSTALRSFDMFARGMLYGGPWLVTGASNIWGTDPADYARFAAGAAMLIPIASLSGIDDIYNSNGFAAQFAKFMAAQLPVDAGCAADGCFPNTPVSPITGIGGIDQTLWNLMLFTGMIDFPMLREFGRASILQMLTGKFQFDDVVNPSGQVYDGLGFLGTKEVARQLLDAKGDPVYETDADGNKVLDADGNPVPVYVKDEYGNIVYDNVMPWSGDTFKLDLLAPFITWFGHLTGDPSDNKIQLPSIVSLGRSIQTLLAGLVVSFDPWTPGSPLCAGFCAYRDQADSFPKMVKFISDIWKGNESLEEWLTAYEEGRANVPTEHNISKNIELFRRGFFNFWDFSNPRLPDDWSNIGVNPTKLAPLFHSLWTSLGLNPDPLDVDEGVIEDAGKQGGVYSLKGTEIPLLLILESVLGVQERGATYAGAFAGVDVAPSDVTNVKWFEPSDLVGPWALAKTIGEDKTPTIVGYSKGAYIASMWKQSFNVNAPKDADGNVTVSPKFVLLGNPGRPNGGMTTRIAPFSIADKATPTYTEGVDGITTTDIAYQYDPIADLPTNLLNPLALMNALFGFINHLNYPDDPEDAAIFQASKGDTNYYLVPSETMPILLPLKYVPILGNLIIDALDPVTRVLVESAYDRSINPGYTASVNPFYGPSLGVLITNVLKAIVVGLDNTFENLKLGRPLGTDRPVITVEDATKTGKESEAYGVGGGPVTLPEEAAAKKAADPAAEADATADEQVEEQAPAAEEVTPVSEVTPVVEEETPVVEEETPVAEEETPVAEEETPAVEEETPVAEEETPAAEEETPAGENQQAPAAEETDPADGAKQDQTDQTQDEGQAKVQEKGKGKHAREDDGSDQGAGDGSEGKTKGKHAREDDGDKGSEKSGGKHARNDDAGSSNDNGNGNAGGGNHARNDDGGSDKGAGGDNGNGGGGKHRAADNDKKAA